VKDGRRKNVFGIEHESYRFGSEMRELKPLFGDCVDAVISNFDSRLRVHNEV